MWIYTLLTLLVLTTESVHANRFKIRKLEKQIATLKADQEFIYETLDELEKNLTAKIETRTIGQEPVVSKEPQVTVIGSSFESRLSDLEGKIETIKNYLMGEKRGDIQLRKKSEKVIEEMNGKVKQTENVIVELKKEVKDSITKFENKISEVNKTANVKINANGAVLYGGIGSACTAHGGECLGDDSECRGGRCQCLPGLSYDIQAQSCVSSCNVYGETYQSVSRKIIRGFNDKTVEETTLAKCKKDCVEETTFLCKSFDYFPQWHTCYMSASIKSDAPEDAWEYNTEGFHFQRDCQ